MLLTFPYFTQNYVPRSREMSVQGISPGGFGSGGDQGKDSNHPLPKGANLKRLKDAISHLIALLYHSIELLVHQLVTQNFGGFVQMLDFVVELMDDMEPIIIQCFPLLVN